MTASTRLINDISTNALSLLHLNVEVSEDGPTSPCEVIISVAFPMRAFTRVPGESQASEVIRFVLEVTVKETNDDKRQVIHALADLKVATGGNFVDIDDDEAERALVGDAAMTAYEFARNQFYAATSLSPVRNFNIPSPNREGLIETAFKPDDSQ